MELLSARLCLRQLTTSDMAAVLEGGRGDGCRWAEGYPMDGTLVALAIEVERLEGQRRHGQARSGFGHFQVVLREERLVIGDIGFHAPPDELGEISVGFGIVPAARGRGYATEALRTLLAWALRQPDVRAVYADTDLVNLASHRVLLSAGMRLASDDGDRRLYEIQAP
jgi:ribosomal-protein-alanine N-acetyltransferase